MTSYITNKLASIQSNTSTINTNSQNKKPKSDFSVGETLIGAGVLSSAALIEGYDGLKELNPKFGKKSCIKFVAAASLIAVPLMFVSNIIENKLFPNSESKKTAKGAIFNTASNAVLFPAAIKFIQLTGVADIAKALETTKLNNKVSKFFTKKPYTGIAAIGATYGLSVSVVNYFKSTSSKN